MERGITTRSRFVAPTLRLRSGQALSRTAKGGATSVGGTSGGLHRSLRQAQGRLFVWESPALRATPLPQDDNRKSKQVPHRAFSPIRNDKPWLGGGWPQRLNRVPFWRSFAARLKPCPSRAKSTIGVEGDGRECLCHTGANLAHARPRSLALLGMTKAKFEAGPPLRLHH